MESPTAMRRQQVLGGSVLVSRIVVQGCVGRLSGGYQFPMDASHFLCVERGEAPLVEVMRETFACRQLLL